MKIDDSVCVEVIIPEPVILKINDSVYGEIIITEPQVSKVNMMGQETFQIIGNINERELSTEPEINEEDIKTVMEQANVPEDEAKKAINDSEGDLAKAILSLEKD